MSTLIDKPRWATDPGADVVEPSAGKKDVGWVGGGEKPPHETFNWLHETTYDWIDNLADGAATYANLQSFIASAEVGDTGIVATLDGSTDTWDTLLSVNLGGAATDVVSVDSDGEVVVTVESDLTVRLLDADTLAELPQSPLTLGVTPTSVVRAVTNGTLVAVAYTSSTTPTRISHLEVFNRDTGATVFRNNLGSDTTATDVAIDGAYAYITNDDGSGAITHFRAVLLSSTGTAAPSDFGVNWGADLNSVWSDGVRAYMGGLAKVGASPPFTAGVHWGAVDIAASVGGPAVFGTKGFEVTKATITTPQAIHGDGIDVYVLDSTPDVQRYAKLGGTAIGSPFTATAIAMHFLTGRYLLQADDSGTAGLIVNDLESAGLASPIQMVSTPGAATSIYCDGDTVLLATLQAASTNLHKIKRGANNTRSWRRMDPTDTFMRLRQLALPMEDSR